MKSNLPSKRYDLYISAFEKYVSEKQKEIDRTRGAEQAYNIVREALLNHAGDNGPSLDLHGGISYAHVTLSKELGKLDKMSDCHNLANKIGEALRDAGLHANGIPATGDCGSSREFTWMLRRDGAMKAQIRFCATINIRHGCADFIVTKEELTMSYTAYKLVPRETSAHIQAAD